MVQQVMVVGLGRFGAAAAHELERLGHEVLAIDRDEDLVNDIAPDVTHAIQLDATDETALRAVGAAEFDHAIVAISSHTEASIFATMVLKSLGVGNVIAKASTLLHGRILERVGADRVVYPEREVGHQVAHTFATPNVLDYLDLAPRQGVARVRPPARFVGRLVGELGLATDLRLTLVAIRRGDQVVIGPGPGERIGQADELVLLGSDEQLAKACD